MQAWIAAETETADFGDARLDRRYASLLDQLSRRPASSLPAACGGLAETTAAYRFFANGRVSPDKVLAPHRDATARRIAAQAVVVIAQDTTEADLTRKQERVGGPLADGRRRGLFAHVLLALTPGRLPLGVVAADVWARDEAAARPDPAAKRRARKRTPIEGKESFRWLQGYRTACAVAAAAPGTCVVLAGDSESDIFECLAEPALHQGPKAEWIIRACQDRAVAGAAAGLWRAVGDTAALGSVTAEVSKRAASTGDGRARRQARSARTAELTVRAARVALRPPRRAGGAAVEVNAVLAREEGPPAGESPVEWLLLTSLPVGTLKQARRVLDYYGCRWEAEVYFRVLKGGCKVEALQLEEQGRVRAALALYLIVAWRVLYVQMLARECPDLPCTAVFSAAEWKSVYVVTEGRAAPRRRPTVADLVKRVAGLGGHLGRKCDGPPGPKALWIGLQRLRDFAEAWTTFGPGSEKDV
jgi:hypothetical protein